MTTTPILGAPELAASQAVPETTVNEAVRYLEQGAAWFRFIDRDDTAPPGSPADGDCYLVAATATGAWAGHDDEIAFYMSTAWEFITPAEGMGAYILDEDLPVAFDGATWNGIGGENASASDIWAASSTAKYISPASALAAGAASTLTSGATITPDGANGLNFKLTLAENATLANPTNFGVGRSGVIAITQDGTGSRTLAYGSNWKFPSGAPVLSTTAGAIDLIAYWVLDAGNILATLTKAYSG